MAIRTVADLDPTLACGLAEVKQRIAEVMSDRLRGIILYGSQARGDTHEYSDVDLMVLLEPPVEWGRDWDAIHAAVYDIQLQRGLPHLSIRPVPIDVFERQEYEIYRAAKEEGIPL